MTPFSQGIAYAALTGFFWALLAIGLKYSLHFITTGTVVWVRMIVAFVLLLLIFLIKSPEKIKLVFLKPPWRVLLAGLFLSFNYYGFMKGLELTSASNAQIMIQLGPLTLLLVGVYYFKEKIQIIQWCGIAIASIGFVFFNWDQFLIALDKGDIYIIGNIWIFFAAVTWTGFVALQKYQILQGWTPQMINLLVYGVCCVALFPSANLSELAPLTLWQWSVVLALGINTLIAYGALGEALQRIPTSYVSLVISINPLLTIFLVGLMAPFGLTFISPEPILWRGYLGAILVVMGVATAVSFRPKIKART